jgi:hypothetical protein
MADKKSTGGAVKPIHRDLGTEEDMDDFVEGLTPDTMAEIADELRAQRRFEAALGDLAFKSNEAAFEYACAFMRCDLVKGQGLPALVVGATHTFGTATPVAKADRGIQTAVLRVASSDDGFPAVALSFGRGPALRVGDLVAWVPGEYREDLAATSTDRRFGWVGLIVGTLEPRYVKGNWVGKATFGSGPQNPARYLVRGYHRLPTTH